MNPTALRILFTLLFALNLLTAIGQADCAPPKAMHPLNGNNIRAMLLTGGDLFWDGDDGKFQVPGRPGAATTIFAQGLWLGAIDPAGSLRLAAQTYERPGSRADYWPGPLDETGTTRSFICENWDRIFSVHRHQTEAHIADFQDNGVVDDPLPEILGWPGRGNPHFSQVHGIRLPETTQGLAPFYDYDGDGYYDPLAGDYPQIRFFSVIPSQISWMIFNDNGAPYHASSRGAALKMEIQLTAWAFDCTDNPILNNTVFTSYKLINRGYAPLDSLHLGIWTDFDIGCYTDDYIGSAPELNTVFAYNSDENDNLDCPDNVVGYGLHPPVQAITFLNQELDYATYHNYRPANNVPPGTTTPTEPQAYYNQLTGRWPDGTPLTFGGDGYDPGGNSPPAHYAFPDDPNDPDGWSEHALNNSPTGRSTVASVYLGNVYSGGVRIVDIAHTFFRESGASHLENVTALYEGIPLLQNWYDSQFWQACRPPGCAEACIWAGDLNADGIANHNDLLAIGLGLGESGPLRPAPYNWSPRSGTDWAGEQENGANDKHLDADGNGLAAYQDFVFSDEFYNQTRPGYQLPTAEYQEGPELFIVPFPGVDFDNLRPGQEFYFNIRMQSVPELYGLAFSLEYDTAYFEYIYNPFSGFGPDDLSFSTSQNHFIAGKALPGRADFSRLATDPGGAIEEGLLFGLNRLKVRETFSGGLTTDQSPIHFMNIKAVRSDGTEIGIGGTTTIATINGATTNTAEPVAGNFSIFPNPTNGRLELRFPGLQVEKIELFTLAGKLAWQQEGQWTDAAAINLGRMPNGLYFLKIRERGKTVVRKVALQR